MLMTYCQSVGEPEVCPKIKPCLHVEVVDDAVFEGGQEVGVCGQGGAVVGGLDRRQLKKLWEVEDDGEGHDDGQVVTKVVGCYPTPILELADELSKNNACISVP